VDKGREEVKIAMAEQDISASREEVEGFVSKLRDFHGSLSGSEQAMLDTILAQAQGETGGFGFRKRSGDQDWDDLVGNLIDEDTQGFAWRRR
jgi:hypothetical protein